MSNIQNIERKPNFTQVCVWPGTTLGTETPADFEKYIETEFGVRTQFLEIILTNPDLDEYGHAVKDTGGRSDIFFAVHSDDVGKFAVPRLMVGIRWIEDVLAVCNNNRHLYPSRVGDYRSWEA